METKKLTLYSGIYSNRTNRPTELSTDTQINGGSTEQPPVGKSPIGNSTHGNSTHGNSAICNSTLGDPKPGELKVDQLTTSELTTNAPTLPRADSVDGLAHGAVTDAVVTDAPETTAIPLPRMARALRHRDFRLFWTGNFLSNIGTWMQNIAQGWLVLRLTNSAFWLGVVGFAASFPILLFALIGGVIADHVNKRKLLMITQSAMMTFAFAMAVLTWLHVINVQTIVLLALGTGIAMSLNTPSYQALVPQLLPREDLTNGIALNSAQFNMSRVIGPTLGGFAMALVGEGGNFFLNGLSFLAVLIALTRINYHDPAVAADGRLFARRDAAGFNPGDHRVEGPNQGRSWDPREGLIWTKMKEGFRYVAAHQQMSSLIILVSIGSLLAIPYLTFVPYFARDVLGTGEPGLGILMACSGAGAFLGAITIAWASHLRRRGLFVVRSSIGFFASIIAFTFSRNFYLSGLLLMAAGYCMIITAATINSLLQHLAADHMRGRVMSIYSTAFLGLPPIGCLAAGSLTHVFSAPHVIAGMCSLAIGGSMAVYVHKEGLRELD
jgi:MFS family permease